MFVLTIALPYACLQLQLVYWLQSGHYITTALVQ